MGGEVELKEDHFISMRGCRRVLTGIPKVEMRSHAVDAHDRLQERLLDIAENQYGGSAGIDLLQWAWGK